MNNFEWLKTLSSEKLARILTNSSIIWKEWVGDPEKIILEWLEGERVDCPTKECIRYGTDSFFCDVCWGKTRRKDWNE